MTDPTEIWHNGNALRAATITQQAGEYSLTLYYGNTGARSAPALAREIGSSQMLLLCSSRYTNTVLPTLELLRTRVDEWRAANRQAGFAKLRLAGPERAFGDLVRRPRRQTT